jgi:hypothetical protein
MKKRKLILSDLRDSDRTFIGLHLEGRPRVMGWAPRRLQMSPIERSISRSCRTAAQEPHQHPGQRGVRSQLLFQRKIYPEFPLIGASSGQGFHSLLDRLDWQ